MESVGKRIKNRRKEMQLTQTDIFEMCGIRSGALSRIENGTSVPSVVLFYKIAQVLECDMDWLFTGISSNSQKNALSKSEEELLNGFRELGADDREEIITLLDVKLRRIKRDEKDMVKSSNSDVNQSDKLA